MKAGGSRGSLVLMWRDVRSEHLKCRLLRRCDRSASAGARPGGQRGRGVRHASHVACALPPFIALLPARGLQMWNGVTGRLLWLRDSCVGPGEERLWWLPCSATQNPQGPMNSLFSNQAGW